MRLLLVRHGDSEHARRGLIADVAGCPGLTADGAAQAQRLAERLGRTGEAAGAVLLSSPVLRARQTAAILAPGLRATVEAKGDLRELIPGVADGLSWDQYRAVHGQFDALAQPDRPFSPGGESWNAFLARVKATMLDLAASDDDRTVVAVTHAGFIVAAMLVMFDIPRPGNETFLDPANTGVTEWDCTAGRWRLTRYNDTAHLAG